MEKEPNKTVKPYYARDEGLRTALYNVMKINNSKYSAADICFVCDVTGSMQTYIELIMNILIEFLMDVAKLINTKPRVAFIGYRDKSDVPQIEFKEFTTDYESMVGYIKRIKCTGGEDACEDIATALERALKLDWSSDLNYVYLIADAPPHGRRYHTADMNDYYPSDDKMKLIEKLATHYRKSKINLAVLKCNEYIDIMIEIIKTYYDSPANKLRLIEIDKKELMKEDFVKQFIVTLSKGILDLMMQSREKNFRRIKRKVPISETDGIEGEIEFGAPFEGRTHTGSISGLAFDNKHYKYTLSLESSDILTCSIGKKKIGTGVFSHCFPLKIGDEVSYVIKVPKVLLTEPKALLPDIEGTLLAKYFANKFNYYFQRAKGGESKGISAEIMKVQVLPLVIVERCSPEDPNANSLVEKSKIFLAQKFLKGEYVKFNNNYGWKSDRKDSYSLLAQAFTHFTYEFSMGYMMVTDIQGVSIESDKKTKTNPGIAITDPAIHSYVLKDRFGGTNHGKIGMIRFFSTHKCNEYCKKLQLRDIEFTSKVDGVKEERKEEKDLNHLYNDYAIDLDAWKKRIQSFDSSIDPDAVPTEEEEEDDIFDCAIISKPR
jgi:hypothetical protein